MSGSNNNDNETKKTDNDKVPSTLSYHVSKIAIPFTIYVALHSLTERILSPKLKSTKLTSSQKLFLYEKIPSTLHAISSFVLSFHLINIKKVFRKDVFRPYPRELDLVFANTTGYMLYDIFIMVRSKEHISVWIHHVMSVLGMVAMMYYRAASYFPSFFVMTEITVVPTNALWIMDRLRNAGNGLFTNKWERVYYASLWLRTVLFLIFRLPSLPHCLYRAITEMADRVKEEQANSTSSRHDKGNAKSDYYKSGIKRIISEFSRLPKVVGIFTTINLSIFGALNSYWTVLVIKALIRYHSNKKVKDIVHHI